MGKCIGIDVGSKFIRTVIFDGEAIYGEEPSAVAVNEVEGKIVACGNAAVSLSERVPGSVKLEFPFGQGKGADPAYIRAMMDYLIKQTRSKGADVIVSMAGKQDSDTDGMFIDALRRAGDVATVDATLCAMLGSGISEAKDSLVVNIGAATVDLAVYSNGKLVKSDSCKHSGGSFDKAIAAYLFKAHKAKVSNDEAERIKKEIASLSPSIDTVIEYSCIRNALGLPRKMSVSANEISGAIESVFDDLADKMLDMLRGLPYRPDCVVLTGGGAKLDGLASALAPLLCLPVYVANEPEYAVIRGIGRLMFGKKRK